LLTCYRSKGDDAPRLGRWPYALAMGHRLCGLSTYGLKAHVREMSSWSPRLSSYLGMALLHLFYLSQDHWRTPLG